MSQYGKWIREGIALIAFALLSVTLSAQEIEGVKVTASLTSGVVKVGEVLTISLVVEGSRDARVVEIPSVEGLTFGAAQPAGTMSRSVNGRRWVSITWAIAVRADTEGVFEIPPLLLEVKGQAVRTRPLSLKAVPDLRGADLGYLEVRTVPSKVVEGQPFTVELLFGWDEESKMNYAGLALPWWNALPGTLELEAPETMAGARTVSMTVNDRIEVAVEERGSEIRDGRTYRSFRLLKHVLPARSGELVFPTSFLEFGHRRRSRSIFDGRSEILDQFFVDAPRFLLEVVPLPTEGQPFDFSGAVGKLEARAHADTRDVIAGDSIKFTVDWTGSGNLEFFETPDPALFDDFAGFRVYGRTEEKALERRRTIYDLAPIGEGVEVIPALPLSVFDPELGEYVTVRTDPIPIRVRPLPEGVELTEERGGAASLRDIRDIDSGPFPDEQSGESVGPGDRTVGAIAILLPLLLLAGRIVVRKRRGDPGAPRARRRRRARRRLARALPRANSPREQLDLFLSFLADRTGVDREAWSGRRSVDWRKEGGSDRSRLSAEGARSIDELVERLEQVVWGDGDSVAEAREVLRTADEAMKEGL
jgi:hypothetical protein